MEEKKGPDDVLGIPGKIVLVLKDAKTGETKWTREFKNLISDAGDLYYAQLGAEEASTNAFGILELGSAHTGAPAKADNRSDITVVASSQKAFDATYPKTNDGDGDNTGAGTDVVSYLVSYTTGEANHAAITQVIVTNVSPGASEPILTHADVTSFAKTSSDTLKVFVNHTMNGV